MLNEQRALSLLDAIQDRAEEQQVAVEARRTFAQQGSTAPAGKPLDWLRRRVLMKNVRELASRYSMRDEMYDWMRAAGASALTGLSVEVLEGFEARLRKLGDRLDVVGDDPDHPPAR